MKETVNIQVSGIVQGVGFRPFVFSQAVKQSLLGWVRNTSSGVEIEIQGSTDEIRIFLLALRNNAPLLAKIDTINTRTVKFSHYNKFEIIESLSEIGQFIPISPDVSICLDCRRELFDPEDRRYHYPFINCTNCGPRFTIIKDIPYDRPQTTMASFKMCEKCQNEYDNPLDRRFHAQPTACQDCGPKIWVEQNHKILMEKEEALLFTRNLLKEGKIVAIKGLGGFHLACDAKNPQAVHELRKRKKRSDKPFALMAFDINSIREQCQISPAEENLLTSHTKPIVLLSRKETSHIDSQVAPSQDTLGYMLPYTPLHLLLLEPEIGMPDTLVMTSGNRSEEPITYTNEDARERLSDIADAFLMNDRDIHMRTDDSVFRIFFKEYPIRRSRGYAPDPMRLTEEFPDILATGAELKNTFCFLHKNYAFMSHHIGDMENYETLQSFEEGIAHFEKLFKIKPEVIACDLHPDYLATRVAQQRAAQDNLPIFNIQHHHAHLASCLADNRVANEEAAIGVIWDGTGLGTDNTIWGGEFLLGNYMNFERQYYLSNVPLPGGDSAIRKPARMALSYLWTMDYEWDPDIPSVKALCPDERSILKFQLEQKINTPMTSSMGRLFDAVASLINMRHEVTFEAQGAIELENIIDTDEKGQYPFSINGKEIVLHDMLDNILMDWQRSVPISTISARFHNGLVQLTETICTRIKEQTGTQTVALSGGVWQNMYMLKNTYLHLSNLGFKVIYHHQVPTNDGGLSLGQAFIAGTRTRKGG